MAVSDAFGANGSNGSLLDLNRTNGPSDQLFNGILDEKALQDASGGDPQFIASTLLRTGDGQVSNGYPKNGDIVKLDNGVIVQIISGKGGNKIQFWVPGAANALTAVLGDDPKAIGTNYLYSNVSRSIQNEVERQLPGQSSTILKNQSKNEVLRGLLGQQLFSIHTTPIYSGASIPTTNGNSLVIGNSSSSLQNLQNKQDLNNSINRLKELNAAQDGVGLTTTQKEYLKREYEFLKQNLDVIANRQGFFEGNDARVYAAQTQTAISKLDAAIKADAQVAAPAFPETPYAPSTAPGQPAVGIKDPVRAQLSYNTAYTVQSADGPLLVTKYSDVFGTGEKIVVVNQKGKQYTIEEGRDLTKLVSAKNTFAGDPSEANLSNLFYNNSRNAAPLTIDVKGQPSQVQVLDAGNIAATPDAGVIVRIPNINVAGGYTYIRYTDLPSDPTARNAVIANRLGTPALSNDFKNPPALGQKIPGVLGDFRYSGRDSFGNAIVTVTNAQGVAARYSVAGGTVGEISAQINRLGASAFAAGTGSQPIDLTQTTKLFPDVKTTEINGTLPPSTPAQPKAPSSIQDNAEQTATGIVDTNLFSFVVEGTLAQVDFWRGSNLAGEYRAGVDAATAGRDTDSPFYQFGTGVGTGITYAPLGVALAGGGEFLAPFAPEIAQTILGRLALGGALTSTGFGLAENPAQTLGALGTDLLFGGFMPGIGAVKKPSVAPDVPVSPGIIADNVPLGAIKPAPAGLFDNAENNILTFTRPDSQDLVMPGTTPKTGGPGAEVGAPSTGTTGTITKPRLTTDPPAGGSTGGTKATTGGPNPPESGAGGTGSTGGNGNGGITPGTGASSGSGGQRPLTDFERKMIIAEEVKPQLAQLGYGPSSLRAVAIDADGVVTLTIRDPDGRLVRYAIGDGTQGVSNIPRAGEPVVVQPRDPAAQPTVDQPPAAGTPQPGINPPVTGAPVSTPSLKDLKKYPPEILTSIEEDFQIDTGFRIAGRSNNDGVTEYGVGLTNQKPGYAPTKLGTDESGTVLIAEYGNGQRFYYDNTNPSGESKFLFATDENGNVLKRGIFKSEIYGDGAITPPSFGGRLVPFDDVSLKPKQASINANGDNVVQYDTGDVFIYDANGKFKVALSPGGKINARYSVDGKTSGTKAPPAFKGRLEFDGANKTKSASSDDAKDLSFDVQKGKVLKDLINDYRKVGVTAVVGVTILGIGYTLVGQPQKAIEEIGAYNPAAKITNDFQSPLITAWKDTKNELDRFLAEVARSGQDFVLFYNQVGQTINAKSTQLATEDARAQAADQARIGKKYDGLQKELDAEQTTILAKLGSLNADINGLNGQIIAFEGRQESATVRVDDGSKRIATAEAQNREIVADSLKLASVDLGRSDLRISTDPKTGIIRVTIPGVKVKDLVRSPDDSEPGKTLYGNGIPSAQIFGGKTDNYVDTPEGVVVTFPADGSLQVAGDGATAEAKGGAATELRALQNAKRAEATKLEQDLAALQDKRKQLTLDQDKDLRAAFKPINYKVYEQMLKNDPDVSIITKNAMTAQIQALTARLRVVEGKGPGFFIQVGKLQNLSKEQKDAVYKAVDIWVKAGAAYTRTFIEAAELIRKEGPFPAGLDELLEKGRNEYAKALEGLDQQALAVASDQPAFKEVFDWVNSGVSGFGSALKNMRDGFRKKIDETFKKEGVVEPGKSEPKKTSSTPSIDPIALNGPPADVLPSLKSTDGLLASNTVTAPSPKVSPGAATAANPGLNGYTTTAPGGALPFEKVQELLADGRAAYEKLSPEQKAQRQTVLAEGKTAWDSKTPAEQAAFKARFPEIFGNSDAAVAAPADTNSVASGPAPAALDNSPISGANLTAAAGKPSDIIAPTDAKFNGATLQLGAPLTSEQAVVDYKKIVAEKLETGLTEAEKGWLGSYVKGQIDATAPGQAVNLDSITADASQKLGERRTNEVVDVFLSQIATTVSAFDPKTGAAVAQFASGAAFLKSLGDLANGKPAGGLLAFEAALGFLSQGVAGKDVATAARGINSLIKLGRTVGQLSDGVAGNAGGAAGAAAAAVAVFASGLFGESLAKTAGTVLSVNSTVQSALGLANGASGFQAGAGVANIASFIVGQIFKSPEGQAAASGLGALGATLALVNVVPGFGQVASAVLAVAGFIGNLVSLGKNRTLEIDKTKDASGDGVADAITFESKPNDWGYTVSNGTLTLPISATSYSLTAVSTPTNGGKVTSTGSGSRSETRAVWADGSSQYLTAIGDDAGDASYRTQSTGRGGGQALTTYTNEIGEVFVLKPGQTTPALTTRGYMLQANAQFAPINDAGSLAGGGSAVRKEMSVAEGQALAAQLGGASGWFHGADPRSEVVRGLLGAQNVSYTQEKKSEGMSYYQDVDGDGVLDRITDYKRIKRQTENLDNTMRVQLLGRDGRERMEYAVNADGSMAAETSVAAQYIPGARRITIGGREILGRIDFAAGLDYGDKSDVARSWNPNAGKAPQAVGPAEWNGPVAGLGFQQRQALGPNAAVAGFQAPVAPAAPAGTAALAAAAPVAAAPVAATPATIQPVPAGYQVLGSTLPANGVLKANQALLSPNGRYLTLFQTDGNLVTYDMLGGMKPIWSTGTGGGIAAGGFAVMQGDGNLVVYGADGQAKWSGGSAGAGVNRAMTLAAQDDGNFVVYDSQGNKALWSSQTGLIARAEATTVAAAAAAPAPAQAESAASIRAENALAAALVPAQAASATSIQPVPAGIQVVGSTLPTNGSLKANQALLSPNGRYLTVFQADGNLVTYDMLGGMKPTWSTGTGGGIASGGFVVMQGPGNLVIYGADYKPKWASGSEGNGVNRAMTLAAQDDGNFVIYDSLGSKALWSSQTGLIARAIDPTALVADAYLQPQRMAAE
jgi:hypothetical protein